MRRIWIVVLVLVALAGLGWLGYSQGYLPALSPTPTPPPTQEFGTVIWASGKVVPKAWATLSFEIGGKLVALPVTSGDNVAEGQVLARLDDTELMDAVNAAQASVEMAEAELARVSAGARSDEVAAARASVMAAEAVREAAQAELDRLRAELGLLSAGPRDEDVETAAASLLKAEAALKLAQAEYDKIAWAEDVANTPQSLALEQTTLDYQVAEANYNAVLQGARDQEIEAARQAVAGAEAGVDRADAEVLAAQASLALLEAGPREEEVDVARSAVAQAKTRLAAARNDLEQAALTAPFSGTVGEVYVHRGEPILPGQPQPVLALGDLTLLQVETTDLRETDVGKISVGQSVSMTFDALPDVELSGHIVSISPKSTSEQGGVNYTTIIVFDDEDSRLRWGMTAYVNIVVE
jgi:HlyD family secretion protein